jgi:ribosomal protein S12 methylthiotransferase accessory factor
VEDRALSEMVEKVTGAGFELRLFDQTTDLSVPCAMAVIRDVRTSDPLRFSLAAGYGCHPVGTRAISRAIAEAAQTRVTNIAGARDDFLPAEYFERLDASTAFLSSGYNGCGTSPSWLPLGMPLSELAQELADRAGHLAEIAWTELGGDSYGISVVRALSGVLEDRDVNVHWRPGKRALKALTGR